MTQPAIYLAGPVAAFEDGGAAWRDQLVAERDNVEFLNPLDRFNVPVDDLTIVEGDSGDDPELVSVSEIVKTDKELLDQADAVLVGYSDVQQIGTPMEVMAGFGADKPIAIWVRDRTPFDELSPWYRYHAGALTNSPDLALMHLRRTVDGDTDE